MCYKGYNLFTHQLVTSSTNYKGYLAFHSPPYGGGVGGGAAISFTQSVRMQCCVHPRYFSSIYSF